MRITLTFGAILLVPTVAIEAGYEAPPSSWNKPAPSFENRRLHLVHRPTQEVATIDELVAQTAIAFRAMHGLRNYFGKEEMRREILDALLKGDGVIALAGNILTDTGFAQEAYKDDQAIARVYAIELLARQADQGDLAPLKAALTALTSLLSAKKEATKGERRDLEDLLYEYLIRSDLSDVPTTLRYFNYASHLKESYMDALAFALRGKMNDANIEKIRSEL